MIKTILMVDDEIKLRQILARELEDEGYNVLQAGTGTEALSLLDKHNTKVLLLDLMLPDMTGLDIMMKIDSLYPNLKTIILTAYGNVESAVTAMKLGAFDYICKPVRFEELKIFLERAFNWIEMKEENEKLKEMVKSRDIEETFVSKSRVMERVCNMIDKVADSDVTVLLEGESGTGKSLLAKRIHEKSHRKDKPFVMINCATIPEHLLESELFGYVKGAFTGANESRTGKFEAANGGTIFLDEIGEVPLSLQAKLLQVTQEKSFTQLGSNKLNQVDVRIITATNRNLVKMVTEKLFRQDLYYRLNIIKIRVPSLRERKEDIPLLAIQFLSVQEEKLGRSFFIDNKVMELLIRYTWPGNIRELKNAIERVTVLSRSENIELEDFPVDIWLNSKSEQQKDILTYYLSSKKSLPDQIEDFEKQLIVKALNEANGSFAKAAKYLKISRQRFLYKLQKYNLHD